METRALGRAKDLEGIERIAPVGSLQGERYPAEAMASVNR
jgi:hypothetical protein